MNSGVSDRRPVGLLHALAQRALGLETPLRSKRAHRRESAAPDALQATTPDLDVHQPALANEPRAATQTPTAAPATPIVASAASPPLPGPARQPASASFQPGAQLPARRDESSAATTAPPQPGAATAAVRPAASRPPATVPAVLPPAPELLLPRNTPPPAVASQPNMPATARSRSQARARSAASTPTEVHVSIGRVELTALSQPGAPRTVARRDATAGRSLADYLRGTKRPP